ncbi:MAG: ABC transporter permease [Chloroflexota bacterium]
MTEATIAQLPQRWFGSRIWPTVEPGSAVWFFRRDRIAVICLTVLLLVVIVSILAPTLTPYADQGRGDPDVNSKFIAPSAEHPFGTDQLGRDVLARVLFGARISLIASFSIVVLAMTFGTVLGAVAGYFGGWVDEIIMRITDIFLAFPPLLLAITIATVLGPNLQNSILAIALTWWPWYTRIVRGQAVSVRERNFVRAARSMGVGDAAIVRRHIIPNIMTPVLVQATLDLGSALLTMASLSFLGLGVQPPTADWGAMVADGRSHVQAGRWWISVFPGLAIFVTTMSFNLLGDGVQTVVDPRIRNA